MGLREKQGDQLGGSCSNSGKREVGLNQREDQMSDGLGLQIFSLKIYFFQSKQICEVAQFWF